MVCVNITEPTCTMGHLLAIMDYIMLSGYLPQSSITITLSLIYSDHFYTLLALYVQCVNTMIIGKVGLDLAVLR